MIVSQSELPNGQATHDIPTKAPARGIAKTNGKKPAPSRHRYNERGQTPKSLNNERSSSLPSSISSST
jgi:hypothetical protein